MSVKEDGSIIDSIPWGLAGDWAACPACKALVERGDRKRLLRRSAKSFVKKNPNGPLSIGQAESALRLIHKEFFERTVGPPIPFQRS